MHRARSGRRSVRPSPGGLNMHLSSSFVPSALALALAAALPMPAGAQTAPADLYIDVATHTMPGMAGLGALGRITGAMGGGNTSYGMARHPGMPGKYMDVALHNPRQPGTPASQDVPKDLRLGDRIDLLPPDRKQPRNDDTDSTGHNTQGLADGGPYTIRYYWGCGEQVRSGQPAEYTMTIRDGKPVQSGRAMTPRKVPQQGVNASPEYALWPNLSSRKPVSTKASLVGAHRVTGGGLTNPMQFDLGGDHDFLPELELKNDGNADNGMALRWNGVDGARAYFIHATAMDGNTIVMWSSSEDGYAGQELIDFLPEALVAQWTKQRTLLGADARSCKVPQEVFVASGAAPMVQMIAYGNDRVIAQPRPSDAPRDWRPAWNAHVRNKSTAMLMPLGAVGNPREAAKPAAKEAAKDAAKGLLRGLLGR